ncbi:hypothetical protein ACR79P_09395 [Sphingobacterium spiritivorum]|uniref:hypothetical protein n=1 Tax=Sphingobacterium spiritivorum TaxID=258 RepID=UPI003DA251E0
MQKIKVFPKSILLIGLVTLLTLTFAQDLSTPPEEEVFETVEYDINGPCLSSATDIGEIVPEIDDSDNKIGSGLQNAFTFAGMNYIDEVLITRVVNTPRKSTSCGTKDVSIGAIMPDKSTLDWYLNLNKRPNVKDIENKIKNKPFGLLKDVPCDMIQQWIDLAKHLASKDQLDKLKLIVGSQEPPSPKNNFTGKEIAKIQLIDDALSTAVNIDYYSVKIDKLPVGFTSADNFLYHIRTNLNDFVFSYFAEFEPYKWYGVNDYNLWNSNNPLNSIIAIDIQGPDNGSVIVTKSNLDSWIFTTIREPHYGSHPVSGNREFGFVKNSDGSYIFYTKGVDRLTSAPETLSQMASDILNMNISPYERTDKLWRSFQYQIERYVNKNGGKAKQEVPISKHPDWKSIKEVIDGKKPISYLNSNC